MAGYTEDIRRIHRGILSLVTFLRRKQEVRKIESDNPVVSQTKRHTTCYYRHIKQGDIILDLDEKPLIITW